MNPTQPWQQILHQPEPGAHIVQAYSDLPFLSETVSMFLDEGIKRGEGIVVVATPFHASAFLQRLKDKGHDVESLRQQGRLILQDAQSLLDQFMHNDHPQESVFNAIVGGVLEKARPGTQPAVRVYGEMVNVLYHQGHTEAAIELEELWNKLGQKLPFSLFCAYEIDPLDNKAYNGALQNICRTHSHFIPVKDYAGLAVAVDRAVEETMGRSLAGTLQALDGISQRPLANMPFAQGRLFWLRDNMPGVGEKILKLAQKYYKPVSAPTD